MFLRTVFVMLTVAILSTACTSTIKPFTSDGCSSFPDGTFTQSELWLNCCTAHDVAYWKGGTYNDRLTADNNLRMCVKEVGEPEIALLMLAGVRVGGTPYLPTTYRWGYGWSYPKLYGALTNEELEQVAKLKTEPELEPELELELEPELELELELELEPETGPEKNKSDKASRN